MRRRHNAIPALEAGNIGLVDLAYAGDRGLVQLSPKVAPEALILRAPGTNCDFETEHAFQMSGARTRRMHVHELLREPGHLANAQILCIPGGFSYGDDLGAGRILSRQLADHLGDAIQFLRDRGGLILGICNGFQVLLQIPGLLADSLDARLPITLTQNLSGQFECRWVNLRVSAPHCVFLHGLQDLTLPVAHAEGRLVARDATSLANMAGANQIALQYTDGPGRDAKVTMNYPSNPNGSDAAVAALTDPSGRILGMMPHPERYVVREQHPRWTRGEGAEPGHGLRLFQNAVAYFLDESGFVEGRSEPQTAALG